MSTYIISGNFVRSFWFRPRLFNPKLYRASLCLALLLLFRVFKKKTCKTVLRNTQYFRNTLYLYPPPPNTLYLSPAPEHVADLLVLMRAPLENRLVVRLRKGHSSIIIF